MKKVLLLGLLIMLYFSFAAAQKPVVDSLRRAYQKNKQDTTLVKLLDVKAVITFFNTNADSGMICARQGLAISRRIHYTYGEVRSLANIAEYLNLMGDLPGALRLSFEVLPKAIAINETYTTSECYHTLGSTYYTLRDLKKSNEYFHKALIYAVKTDISEEVFGDYNNITRNFLELNMLDSALWYTNKGYTLATKKQLNRHLAYSFKNFGIIQFKKGNYSGAINFYNESLAQKASFSASYHNHNLRSEDLRLKAEAYQKLNKPDSCIYFAQQAYEEAILARSPEVVMKVTSLLASAFKSKNNYRQAFEYQQIMLKAKDSLFNQQKTLQVKNLEYSELQRQEEVESAKAEYQNKVRFYALLTVIGVFILIALFLLHSNQARKKANKRLYLQNQKIQAQQKALEETLTELKSTQTQLIQREKMASLGELTAGIAHEIQNPLNFVNNFSDVNKEMVAELKEELRSGNIEEALAIAADIAANEEKINHHGKRADSIVKGMLEHSRVSSGDKQPTDLNALAGEFLKLSYNGVRAKDKSFNAELITNLDSALPKINLVPQDIGRVLLNLLNNAFYAVYQKSLTANADYTPKVVVTTLAEKGQVIIKVKDNGNGIPDAIKDKIMQPFFTTKPTGEGTGLGLSLSYDIVVKGHGGSIDIITKESEFAEFIIRLQL